MQSNRYHRHFSLMELMLACGILGMFLYICANTLVSTLQMQEMVIEESDRQKEQTMGWSIIHRDLAYAIGIYYHHMSLWEAPNTSKTKDPKNAKKKEDSKKKGRSATSDELFSFTSEPEFDEAFLEIVTSRGRLRDTHQDEDEESLPSQFRKIKYYLGSYNGNDEDIPRGDILLRTEERWQEASDNKKKIADEEREFDLDNIRRHGVIFGLRNVELFVYTGTEWVDEWSSLKKGDLPIALKISYEKENQEETSLEPSERIIPIPISYQIVGEPEDSF